MPNQPLSGARLVWITLALSLATFMQVLDSTIANVALPTIAGNLGVAYSQGTWVVTSFGVANAISIPLTGWLAKRFGEVRLFLIATLMFVVTSWLCGLASSLNMLIFFRVLQGAVAGPVIPLSQSLLLSCYPNEKKGMALALWSMTVIIAPIFGPILGGVISDNWHWGWIFFINIPVGIIAAGITWKQMKGRETPTEHKPIDRMGLMLLALGIGSLQVMLDQGKDLDWFNSSTIIALTVVAVVALTFLVIWELTDKHPVIDLSIFRSRNFTVGVICTAIGYLIYFGSIVLLPTVLQTQLGYTATTAGLASAPIGFFPVLLSPLIGRYSHRIDMRWLVTLSFTVFAICFFWRGTFSPDMDFRYVVWPQVVQGIGVACFFMPLTTITLAGLRPDQIASASSLSNFLRVLGGSIGTSISTTMWDRREALHHALLTEHVTPFDTPAVHWFQQLHALGLSQMQEFALTAQEITRQGYILGSNEVFWIAGWMFVGLTLLVWFARPPFRPGSGGGGAH